MNLILQSPAPVSYFTDVGSILRSAGIDERNFDWYVSDVDTNFSVPGLGQDGRWFSGDELAIVLENERLQFIWGVLSAVLPGQRPFVASDPFSDGNPAYWQPGEVKPQLPDAVFELTCWDSSAAILIGLSQEQASAFLASFPMACDLSEAS